MSCGIVLNSFSAIVPGQMWVIFQKKNPKKLCISNKYDMFSIVLCSFNMVGVFFFYKYGIAGSRCALIQDLSFCVTVIEDLLSAFTLVDIGQAWEICLYTLASFKALTQPSVKMLTNSDSFGGRSSAESGQASTEEPNTVFPRYERRR